MEAECIPQPCNLIHACSFSSAMEKSQQAHDGSDMMAAVTSCFDCNICLDSVADPVVTLCGHLYCWPCIYKWMQAESMSHRQCPVCKAFLSPDTIVPLFGRGRYSGPEVAPGIPLRPQFQQQHHHHRRRRLNGGIAYDDYSSSSLTAGVGGLAFSVLLPWAHGRRYILPFSGDNPRLQRQQLQVERSLHQIWVFLFCCAVVCLLVF